MEARFLLKKIMDHDIFAAAFELRKFSRRFKAVSLGHTQQLVASAVGFKSLAAYQARNTASVNTAGSVSRVSDLNTTLFQRRISELLGDVDWRRYLLDVNKVLVQQSRRAMAVHFHFRFRLEQDAIAKFFESLKSPQGLKILSYYLADVDARPTDLAAQTLALATSMQQARQLVGCRQEER